MPCLLLILSLYSIQNCYPLQTGTLQGFESSCPLLKKDFGKNYCPCPLLKKQLLQKYSSCLLLKKQIKNKYFSCLLFLTTTRQHKIVAQSLCKGVKPQNGRAFFLFHNIPVAFPVRILSKQKRRSRPHLKLLLARAVSRRYGHLFAHLTLCRVFSIGTEKRVEAKASSPSQRVCRKNRLFVSRCRTP